MLDPCDEIRTPRPLRSARCAIFRLALLVACLASPRLTAQPGMPLFAANDVLALTLEAPMRTLISQRTRRPDVDGVLSYATPDGAPVVLDAEISTRGHSRLEICSFPPLRVNLKRGQVEGTLFAGQNRLKLVTLCRERGDYDQYLELEYLAYRIFNEVTEYGFRVRPISMRYIDTDRDGAAVEAPAFFIEPIDGVAARVGMQAVDVQSISPAELDAVALATLSVFQFLVGNTDFSVLEAADGEDCCHNSDVLASIDAPPTYIAVPYDFDQTGLVNARYAAPSERLGIRLVTQRRYRGLCSANAHLAASIAAFNAARPRIEALLESARLNDDSRERASDFLGEGFAVLNDAAALEEQVIGRCRG